jgi:hypothetical protein
LDFSIFVKIVVMEVVSSPIMANHAGKQWILQIRRFCTVWPSPRSMFLFSWIPRVKSSSWMRE